MELASELLASVNIGAHKLTELPKIGDKGGNITFVEAGGS